MQYLSAMKKVILFFTIFLICSFASAQTATNFTCYDCEGNFHTLFNELDSGKVIVIDWVEPCAPCIPPSVTTYNVVGSYQSAYPGRVFFYLADDYANTSCSSLKSWSSANSMPNADFVHIFSDTSVNMLDYGSTGMPKIVVLGCSSHQVFYNVVTSVDPSALQAAINSALQCGSGISETDSIHFSAFMMQENNGAQLQLALTMVKPAHVEVEIYNSTGEKINQVFSGSLQPGQNIIPINTTGLAKGIYLAKIYTSSESKVVKFVVVN